MADSTKVESKLPTLPRNPMPSHPDSAAAAPPGFPFRRAWQACLAWLGDVPIPDPDLRANAVLIQVLGALGALGLGLGALMRALGPAPLPPGPGRVLILSAVLLALGPVLVRLGHFRGSLGCISAALFVNVGAAMIGGGVTHGLGLTREAVIPLAIAALLLDRRTLWGMYGLIVAICTLGMAREHGLLGPAVHYPVAVPPFGAFGSTVIVFLFITVVLDRLSGKLRQSLAETRERQQALRESEANLRMTIDLFPDAAVTMRLDTMAFVSVSAGFTAYTGLAQEQVIGHTPLDFQLWEDLAERGRFLEAIHRDGAVHNLEARFHVRGGRVSTALVQGKVFTRGGVPHLLTVLRDITEWKRAQEERDRMQEQLEHSQRLDSLGSLAGGVAHDYNNMLNAIIGFADLLLDGEPDPARRGHLQSILLAATRSADLTRNLLAFARKGRNLVEPVDLRVTVEDCLALLRPAMPPDLEVAVDLADCPGIDADPGQVHQVVLNLCLNAVEAMAGTGTLSLRARGLELDGSAAAALRVPPGRSLEFPVADTGPGMPEAVRQRVFEPFFTTKAGERDSGTGLGLSTVYGIVLAHGGSIEVASAPGQGSRFTVLFPEGRLARAEGRPRPLRHRGEGKVLVVEDEPILREAAAAVLESLGYSVLEAGDGQAGVSGFQAHHHDLYAVLLDLKMPVMGGREAFGEMHRIDPEVPVLVCTGFGENEEVQELRSLGAGGMLSKPYRIADLAEALGRLAQA